MIIPEIYIMEKRNIFPNGKPYLTRWIVFECGWFGFYVHKFWDSDYERALHDHPWNFVSIVLKGSYLEWTDNTVITRKAGSIAYRSCTHKHRVELTDKKPVWTLMFVSKRLRPWGFWPSTGWCHWRKFDQENNVCGDKVLYTYGKD